jgi:hypothetical protein
MFIEEISYNCNNQSSFVISQLAFQFAFKCQCIWNQRPQKNMYTFSALGQNGLKLTSFVTFSCWVLVLPICDFLVIKTSKMDFLKDFQFIVPGLALLGVSTVICDFLLMYIKEKGVVKQKK